MTFSWNNAHNIESTLPARYTRYDQKLDFFYWYLIITKFWGPLGTWTLTKLMAVTIYWYGYLKFAMTVLFRLSAILIKCLEFQTFPTLWKHANILPIHKKQSRQLIKKLQTNFFVTYLWKKTSRKTYFNYIYEYFSNNSLITPNQSGFGSRDSNINQLLSITHNIYEGFLMGPLRETRAVFLDITESFAKAWQ